MTSFYGVTLQERRFGGIRVVETRHAPAERIPLHEHARPFLSLVLGGAYEELVGGSRRDHPRLSAAFHPAGERHADVFGGGKARLLNLELDAAPSEWRRLLDEPFVAVGTQVAGMIRRLRRELACDDDLSPMVTQSLVLELLVASRRTATRRAAPPWLRRADEMLRASFRSGVGVSDLARAVGVHPTHVARTFRAQFGQSVGERVRALRVEWAKEALRGEEPIARVALDAGFADQSHFTRTFRLLAGMTPSEYRRRGL